MYLYAKTVNLLKGVPNKLWYIVLIALILRLLIGGAIFSNFGSDGFFLSDSWGFYYTAENILAGNGFSQETAPPYTPGTRFPPLYPIFIATSLLISNSIFALLFVQVILSSLLPLLVWKIGSYLTERKLVLYIAALLAALEPFSAYLSVIILTDVTAVFFLLLGVLFLIKLTQNFNPKNSALAGFFMGISSLIRPEAYFISLIIILIMLATSIKIGRVFSKLKKRNLIIALFFTLVFALTISPWIIRNYKQFGTIAISSTGARNVYSSIATSVLTYESGRPFHEVAEEMRNSFAKKHNILPDEITTNPAFGSELVKEGFTILLKHPQSTAVTVAVTLSSFFTQDLYLTYLNHYNFIERVSLDFSPTLVLIQEGPLQLIKQTWDLIGINIIIPIFGRLLWVSLFALWIIGSITALKHGGRERIVGIILTAMILIYAAGSAVAGFSDHGRHRYRVNHFIYILASYGGVMIYDQYKRKVSATHYTNNRQ